MLVVAAVLSHPRTAEYSQRTTATLYSETTVYGVATRCKLPDGIPPFHIFPDQRGQMEVTLRWVGGCDT